MLSLALLLALAPGEAPVEVQRVGERELWSLDWRAPEACLSGEQVGELIQDYAPGLPAPAGPRTRAELRIVARLAPVEAGGWSASLDIHDSAGMHTREFSAASCEELGRATALIAAVMLDPVRAAMKLDKVVRQTEASAQQLDEARSTRTDTELREPAMPEPAPSPLPAYTSEPVPLVPAPAPTPAQPSRLRRIGLSLNVGPGYGPTRAAYAAVGGGLSVNGPRWRWQLDGGGWLPQVLPRGSDDAAAPIDPLGSGLGRFSGWWLGTRGCFVPAARPVEFPLCPGVELGQVRARAIDPIDDTGTFAELWAAALVSAGVHWRIRDALSLTTDLAVLVPFRRADIVLDSVLVQSLAPVGVRGTIGLELRL